jgi:MFS family permease
MDSTPSQDRPSNAASRWTVLVTMCAGYFLVLLDVTIVNVALPQIGAGLSAGVDQLQWVVDGYALALAALLLAGGSIGDLCGTNGSFWWAWRCSDRPRSVAGWPRAPAC